jgi:two-component system cell cycle sensor histidine kinase/response regulator CckA
MIMPGMSGREVFNALVAMEPDVRVLVSIGYGVEGKVSDLVRGERIGFIQKPFSIKVLANEVRRLLDEK